MVLTLKVFIKYYVTPRIDLDYLCWVIKSDIEYFLKKNLDHNWSFLLNATQNHIIEMDGFKNAENK